MSEWKPIETAPNGKTILVARMSGDGAQYVELIDACDNDYAWEPYKRTPGVDSPTHWMEPPTPPDMRRRPRGKPGGQS